MTAISQDLGSYDDEVGAAERSLVGSVTFVRCVRGGFGVSERTLLCLCTRRFLTVYAAFPNCVRGIPCLCTEEF